MPDELKTSFSNNVLRTLECWYLTDMTYSSLTVCFKYYGMILVSKHLVTPSVSKMVYTIRAISPVS